MDSDIYESASHCTTNIYNIVLETGASLRAVVDDWIDSYKKDKEKAVINLLQFFVNSSGCKGVVYNVSDDFSAIIRELTKNFKETSSEYPLILSGRKWKLFRSNLCDFLDCFIKGCQNSILYDDYLMPKVVSFLTGLTDSQVRAFRHTSTLAVMKIITALVEVYKSMKNKRQTSERQLAVEEMKPKDRRTQQKFEHIKEMKEEIEENLSYLEGILSYLFKAVFVFRFRDSVPAIRIISVTELGIWLKKLPELFLDDSHLKYIAWSLNDKINEMRKISLACLISIFKSKNLHSKLELFVLKCKERIISMTLDVDPIVAVEAINLVSLMNEGFAEAFTSTEIESVYQLVFAENAIVAHAAGNFLNKKLSEVVNSNFIRPLTGRRITSNEIIIKEVVNFFIESELHDHTAYLVDSLIESSSVLKDWDSMTNLLLCEVGNAEEALTAQEEKVIIDLMASCVKQATSGRQPVGRNPVKTLKTVKDLKNMSREKEKVTLHFISILPDLINKFLSDPTNVSNLLQIPLHFDLNLFLNASNYDSVISIMKVLQVVFDRYDDSEVLESCAKLFNYFCDDSYSLSSVPKAYTNSLVEICIRKLNSELVNWENLTDCPNGKSEDIAFTLVSCIKKISILYPLMNLNNFGLWNIIFENLRKITFETSNFPEEFVKYALFCCYYIIIWDLNSYEDKIETSGSINVPFDILKNNFTSFMNLNEFIIKNLSGSCADAAFKLYCDSLLIFCCKTSNKFSRYLEGFFSSPSSKVRDVLFKYLQSRVFVNLSSVDVGEIFERRTQVSSYCKLITFQILPVYFISDVLLYYGMTYSNFGDIIDITIASAMELDKVDLARAMINSLIILFREAMKGHANIPNDIPSLKKLAKKFSSILGTEKKNDVFLKALHTEGIMFALKEMNDHDSLNISLCNAHFFDLLVEFCPKLSKCNKSHLLNFLNEKYLTVRISNSYVQYFDSYKKCLSV